ncbi:hypothetical protein [Sporomusa termitida]|uniref:LVIVD repeat protein n=1 Tax=Sporomusa termitida TaxID=2377 RepID=A0A517DVM3_9FIRM|nr:hypothetical protein [Sporomusa termitida]QDR81388.1 hypothetical protein SPTER_27680 [Sporomusa termitida]
MSEPRALLQESVLAAGVMKDYTTPGDPYGCISQVDSAGTVHAGVVKTLPGGNYFEGHDARVLNFVKGSEYKALVVDYTYSPTSSLYGIFDPAANGIWGTPVVRTDTNWDINNPYSIVTNGNDMFLMGYDSQDIIKVDLTTFNAASGNPFFTYTPLAGKEGHGVDMDAVEIDGTLYLAALFINAEGYSNYGNSQLVLVEAATGDLAATIDLNANANSIAIAADNFAYVTSFGGVQQPGGNATSRLQVVDLNASPPAVTQTIGIVTPVTAGDYVDVALVDANAYVLTANFDGSYSNYTYRLVRTTQASLKAGNFGTSSTYSATVPSGATWLLAYDGIVLWFVRATEIYTIDTSVALSSSALTLRANAGLYNATTNPQGLGIDDPHEVYGQLNTAAVVIPAASAAPRAFARGASHTKHAKVMLPPEELEKFKAAAVQAAAAQEKK